MVFNGVNFESPIAHIYGLPKKLTRGHVKLHMTVLLHHVAKSANFEIFRSCGIKHNPGIHIMGPDVWRRKTTSGNFLV